MANEDTATDGNVDPAAVNADGANANPTIGDPAGDGTQPTPDDAGAGAGGEPKPPEGDPKTGNHDARRMKKFMDEAARLKAENLALQAQLSGGGRQQQPQAQKAEPPKRENFTSDEEYLDAKVDFRLKQVIPEVENTIRANTQKSAAEVTFQQREAEIRKDKPDYDEVIAEASDVRIPPIAAEAIMTSEYGPDLRYYLANNPDKAARLNTMSPVSVAREIGIMEAEIRTALKASPAPVRPSGAPAPIRPPVANGGRVETDLDKMDMDSFMKTRTEQRKKLGKQY
jgi:hypothetical protein